MGTVRLQGNSLVVGITLSSASCYLLFGYDQGVLGGLVTQPSFLDAIGNPSAGYLGAIVALYNVGCLVGCVIAALYGNVLGRKKSILWGCMIMTIGAVIQAATYGAAQLIAGRIISGIGNGINTSTIPVYVSETAKSNRRGQMIAIQLSIVIFGTVAAYRLDYGCIKHLSGSVVWRFPIAFQIVFALITIVTIPFLPDTPRWLYSHGRQKEAINILLRLMSCSEGDPQVRLIENEMKEAIQLEYETQSFNWKNIFYDRTDMKNYRRLILCFMIQMMQQMTGINVIAFYVTIVLESNVGLDRQTSSLAAGCIQIAFWLGTFPPMYTIDRFGRRPILLAGSVALTATMVLSLALAMLLTYEISFGMSWNSLPWLIAPEITPLHLRHIGSAIGPFSEWLWTFVIVLITPIAIENAGWKFYLLFCIMNLLAFPLVYFLLPETKGKTLEEIDYVFASDEARAKMIARFARVAGGVSDDDKQFQESYKQEQLEV
ncbi:general substrate transporter [Bisporella sp. PMI_857]|nr:general substrate transporter [Bisporella sp. PMI_857]